MRDAREGGFKMAGESRIRISISHGELEIEGSPAFIEKYSESIDALLKMLKEGRVKAPAGSGGKSGGESKAGFDEDGAPSDFGERLHGLPNQATGSEQILVAGKFAQGTSADNSFSTADANKLLVDQGVKLSNASQAMRGNLSAKRVFKVNGSRWRISKQGEDHLKTLIRD